MERNVSLEEISDGKRYEGNDLVKADCGDCEGCSACCQGMGSSILLDPYDIKRMEEGLCMEDVYKRQATDHVGVDVVFECSGSEPSALEVTKLCRIGGMICLTGVHKVPHAVNLQDVNFKEQTLVGSRVYTLREFGQAVEYAKEIAPELEKIVTHIVPLAESEKVFDLIKDPSEMTVKVLVDCR